MPRWNTKQVMLKCRLTKLLGISSKDAKSLLSGFNGILHIKLYEKNNIAFIRKMQDVQIYPCNVKENEYMYIINERTSDIQESIFQKLEHNEEYEMYQRVVYCKKRTRYFENIIDETTSKDLLKTVREKSHVFKKIQNIENEEYMMSKILDSSKYISNTIADIEDKSIFEIINETNKEIDELKKTFPNMNTKDIKYVSNIYRNHSSGKINMIERDKKMADFRKYFYYLCKSYVNRFRLQFNCYLMITQSITNQECKSMRQMIETFTRQFINKINVYRNQNEELIDALIDIIFNIKNTKNNDQDSMKEVFKIFDDLINSNEMMISEHFLDSDRLKEVILGFKKQIKQNYCYTITDEYVDACKFVQSLMFIHEFQVDDEVYSNIVDFCVNDRLDHYQLMCEDNFIFLIFRLLGIKVIHLADNAIVRMVRSTSPFALAKRFGINIKLDYAQIQNTFFDESYNIEIFKNAVQEIIEKFELREYFKC